MMTRLTSIKPERLAAARDIVFEVFEKACRLMGGHSQPLETLGIQPTLQELEADWKNVHDARDAYLKS